jgi:Ca2+:H+ antiporter
VHQEQILHGIDTQHRPWDKNAIKTVVSPSFPASITFTTRAIIFHSWINVLLVFVPVAIVTYLTKAHPIIVFTTNAIAIIPLSGLLTYATECIANEAGDTVGALINISFGNLVEIVIL